MPFNYTTHRPSITTTPATPSRGDTDTPTPISPPSNNTLSPTAADSPLEDLGWSEQQHVWEAETETAAEVKKNKPNEHHIHFLISEDTDHNPLPISSSAEDARLAMLIKNKPGVEGEDDDNDKTKLSGALDDSDTRCCLPLSQCEVAKQRGEVLPALATKMTTPLLTVMYKDGENKENASPDGKVKEKQGKNRSADDGKEAGEHEAETMHAAHKRFAGAESAGETTTARENIGEMSGWRLKGESDSEGSDRYSEGDFDDDRFDPDMQYNVATRHGWL